MQDQLKNTAFTIATGSSPYWDMALNLARSFKLWHANDRITFAIVTDLDLPLAPSLNGVVVRRVPQGSLGAGFSSKLILDQLAPTSNALFIDSDCLCFGPLHDVFDRFAGRAVSVIGGQISDGEWFGDVAAVCRQVGVTALPKFNGGIYYVERGAKSKAVYERARALEAQYDALGLVRLRGQPNDELVMAIAMAQEGCTGIPEDGSVMGDLLSTPKVAELDVLAGRAELHNPPAPHRDHRPWFPLQAARPKVVHFLGSHVRNWRYQREARKLRLAVDHGLPRWLASMCANAAAVPQQFVEIAQNVLRPAYRTLFGTRKVRSTSSRFDA